MTTTSPFILLTLALLAAAAQTPPTTQPAPLQSSVFDWAKLAVKTTANGERREVVDSPTTTFRRFESHITTLNEGKIAHAAHRHPDEEIIIVKEGTLEVTVAGRTQTAGPGSTFFFASNDLHGLKNAGKGRATYHVIRIITTATPPAPATK